MGMGAESMSTWLRSDLVEGALVADDALSDESCQVADHDDAVRGGLHGDFRLQHLALAEDGSEFVEQVVGEGAARGYGWVGVGRHVQDPFRGTNFQCSPLGSGGM